MQDEPAPVKRKKRPREVWRPEGVLALRRHLGLSQEALAEELGTRQQTVSEWETGRYRPRGVSARMLSVIAERAGFQYDPSGGAGEQKPETGDGGPGEGNEKAEAER